MRAAGKGTVALLAGDGILPQEVARAVEAQARPLLVVALEGITAPDIQLPGRRVKWVELGKFQSVLDLLRAEKAEAAVLAGRVRLSALFDPTRFDQRLLKLLASLPDKRGNAVLLALVREIESEGVPVLSNLEMVPELATPRGLLAGPDLTPAQRADAVFGWKVAKECARLDIGQMVAVKGGTVVAVEAIEGTDRAIARAGELVQGSFTVVKVASPGHDFRIDVPTAGPGTIRSLVKAGGGVVVMEAGRSFLLEPESAKDAANREGVSLVGGDDALFC